MATEEIRHSSLSTSNTEPTAIDINIHVVKYNPSGYPKHICCATVISPNKIISFGDNSTLNLKKLKWSRKYTADIDVYEGAACCQIKSNLAIVFGGWNGSEYSDKLQYFYKGYCGEILQTKNHPQGRKGHTLTYDPITDSIYLFGGWNSLKWGNNINDDRNFRCLWIMDNSNKLNRMGMEEIRYLWLYS